MLEAGAGQEAVLLSLLKCMQTEHMDLNLPTLLHRSLSGMAGFLKAVLCVNQRVIPPTFNIINPNELFSATSGCYPVLTGRVLAPDRHMTAGKP